MHQAAKIVGSFFFGLVASLAVFLLLSPVDGLDLLLVPIAENLFEPFVRSNH